MAGTLQAVLDLGLQFAAEREQFGRSISKFQAIQHSLAVVAAEVAAAQRAADAGVDALGTDRFVAEVAASKARVGEAVGIVAEQVHQVHGAMGFTHEHRLHHFTRRLWAWRDEWGNVVTAARMRGSWPWAPIGCGTTSQPGVSDLLQACLLSRADTGVMLGHIDAVR